MLPRSRPDVDDPVGPADCLLVMFDDEDRVAAVAKPFQHAHQPRLLGCVEPDRRLVEDVEDAAEVRPHLRRQADPLGLAAGKGRGHAVERQVSEAELLQQRDAAAHLRPNGVPDRRFARREVEAIQPGQEPVHGERRHLPDVQPPEPDGERLGPQPRPAACLAREAPHEAEDVAVAAAPEDLLHHREDPLVDPLLARLRRDAAPAHARFERVLAVRDADDVRPVEHDRALFVRQVAPRGVHVEAVRPAHLVEHVDRHLGVDHVAGRRRDDERALANRLRGIGDEQVRVEAVLDAKTVADRTGAGGRVERKQPALDPKAGRRLAEAREEQAEVVVQAGESAHGGARAAERRLLIDGDGGREAGDRIAPTGGPRGRGTAARTKRSSRGSAAAPRGRSCRTPATTCPIPTPRRRR